MFKIPLDDGHFLKNYFLCNPYNVKALVGLSPFEKKLSYRSSCVCLWFFLCQRFAEIDKLN